ncbi:fumarylacetoacetate hydrolase family protein [Nocardioides sp. Root151]|uniref:fumarylacetoacetate hydrolase family protein n=1 Tax=Nocardioides sp. Root151 TaxID=1736475 RepID=UPI000703B72C|nr:fumarylacetoacetate hydrolase family protein [Nocardioides sp. Root151]KQZ67519.1 2-hydroxyhepta-2,4-diene-1,7-dioate isomerase [Nocardioides sp. Root151]
MKLLRVGAIGRERPAALDASGLLRDLSSVADDIDARLLTDPVRMAATRQAVHACALPVLPPGLRLGAPVARPGKVVGIGLNYKDHALETGASIPDEPVVFLKPGTSVCGPADTIALPAGSTTTDHEVELGVVMGARLSRCHDPSAALASVGGYVTADDVSERSRIAAGPTWAKGKCADTFTPIGPWLVTPDEVGDPQALTLTLTVNDEVRQSGTTSLMAYGVGELLAYVSTLMTLEPGDLVLTGTPGGVAAGRPEPKPYLRDGDVVEAEVIGLGRQRTPVSGIHDASLELQ